MKAKVKPFHPTRFGGGKGRIPRGAYDWSTIRADYITSMDVTRPQFAKKWGVGMAALDGHIYHEGWPEARKEFQDKAAKRLQDAALKETVDRKKEGITLIYALKLQVARKLQDRIQRAGYRPSVRDLELLQRLEMDLRAPGWSKAPGEGSTTVNVGIGVRLENIVEELQAQRARFAIDAEKEDARISTSMDSNVAEFLYADDTQLADGSEDS